MTEAKAKWTMCPKCRVRMPCRAGGRPVPGEVTWKRRRRDCPECGASQFSIELPERELKSWLSKAGRLRL